eukprot:sb/3477905/
MVCFSFFQTRQRQHDSSFFFRGKKRAIEISSESCVILSNKVPRIMLHISYRLTLLMRSPESCHDSGKLISSVIQYEILSMIQGILLSDMRHDSEFLCSSGAHET